MTVSVTHELFGDAIEIYGELLASIASQVTAATYTFIPDETFVEILKRSPTEGMKIYWTEVLYRAHWAAASNILRHQRWHDSCLKLYAPEPNLLGFSAALRGLLEASADASHSLRGVPLTLAENHCLIREALRGRTSTLVISRELEEMLIHFQFARKASKNESLPRIQQAETATEYFRTMDPSGDTGVRELYADLCQIVHPAAQSMMWMFQEAGDKITYMTNNGQAKILYLCKAYSAAIESAYVHSLNSSILILKVLNALPLGGLWTPIADSIDMKSIPAWQKIGRALAE